MYICSAQSENWYNFGSVPAQSENSYFVCKSGIVLDNFRIAQGVFYRFLLGPGLAQSRNRLDKVGMSSGIK